MSDTLTESDLTWQPTTIIRNANLVNEIAAPGPAYPLTCAAIGVPA